MNTKPLIDEIVKLTPEDERPALRQLADKIKTAVAGAPEKLKFAAMQLVALEMISDPVDPDAVTAVEPAITEEEP